MEIRLADEKEKEQVKKLWRYCFYDTDPYLTWFFDNVFKPENTVVAVINGEIAGALQLLPYTIVIRNESYPCYYIAGVSISPQARGSGVGRAIMEFAEEVSSERGIEVLALIPAVDNFYEKFGYVSCYERIDYKFSPLVIKPKVFYGKIKKAEENDINTLLNLYNKYIKGFDGYILRTLTDMKNIYNMYTQSNGGIYIFYGEDSACGYIFYDINVEIMNADEVVYTSSQAIDGILGFIYSHNSQTRKVCLRAALNDLISGSLYFNNIKAEKVPTVMLKLLNGENPRLMVGQIDGEMSKILYGTNNYFTLQKNYVNILT